MNFHGLEFDGVPIDQDVDGSDSESISSLIDEDVDFDHVYALFEFPAMVEGQVTVHDGEKLTLVDDSNSYWWLVSVARNGQVGYIPADNVETAREKLARVNRHKNLKLCMADPEHIVKSKMKTVPALNARKVQFNNKLVTQEFVADPRSGDEYDDDDDDDYSYDEESDEETGGQRVDINGSRITMRYSMIDPSKGDDVLSDGGSEYDYYYSSDSGNPDRHVPESLGTDIDLDEFQPAARNIPAVRRAQTPKPILGESLADSDDEMDNEPLMKPAARTSLTNGSNIAADIQGALTAHMVSGQSDFYPSNEDSDEGDSIMGSALEVPDNDEDDEVGRYSLRIRHVDAFSTSDTEITVFSDEMFSEVLYRALSVFTLAPALKSGLCLHAQVQQRSLVPLNSDGQVSSFLDYLRESTHAMVPESGEINPSLCTIILSDKSLPRSRLLPEAAQDAAEDDPYMDIDDGSRNILRTSIATSLSESVGVAASDSESIMTNQSPIDTLRMDLPLPATVSKEKTVEAPSDRKEPAPQQTEAQDAPLPDSRSVVQGLLRRIQPPSSRPPQSAIDRAKRNTVQLSGLSSIIGDLTETRNSPPPLSAPRGLTRSASTRGYGQSSSDSASHINHSQLTRPSSIAISRVANNTAAAANESRQRKRMTALDAICADIESNRDLAPSAPVSAPAALDNSVSTLRSSSDTAADAVQPDTIAADQPPIEDDEDNLLSPLSSSDTASLPRDTGSSQQLNHQTSLSVATRSLQSLKDNNNPPSPVLDVARASLLFAHEELPLDDWLVLLRGWNDMHDMAASTSEFYSTFLREMQEVGEHSAHGFIQQHVEELKGASRDTQQAIDDILGVSQGVGRRLDTLERELDDIARILVHAN